MKIKLLVYGTLKKGQYNHTRFNFNNLTKFISNLVVPGFSLVQESYLPYPFCINDKDGEIKGELYEILDSELLESLDVMKYGAGYKRVQVNVDGQEIHLYVDNSGKNYPESRYKRFKEF